MQTKPETPFENIIQIYIDQEKPLNTGHLYRLSDLEDSELIILEKYWLDIPIWRRIAIMEHIEELGDVDLTLSFEAMARFCMSDLEPKVRELAIRTLWDYELPDLIPTYLDIIERDADTEVRAATVTALSKYIYMGEVEELSRKTLKIVEDKLIEVFNSKDDKLVRRRALEALGFSSRVEVPDMINEAYYSGDKDWLVSGLFAMGRSANKNWKNKVLEMLEADQDEVLTAAIQAAGELEISEARASLFEILTHEDEDVRMAAIWSLSQIGGEGVGEYLEELYEEAEDPQELELLEAALDNLAFTEDIRSFDLMDYDDEDFPEFETNDPYDYEDPNDEDYGN